jgi:peptidyl-dipeptidase A
VTDAETRLARAGEFANRAAWVRANFITTDTQWLETKAGGEFNELASRLAKSAAQYNRISGLDPDTARKLLLLQRALVLPAPARAGAADQLAALGTKLDSTYSTGKFTYKGKQLTLNDAEDILASSRDPAELKAVYEGWRTISPAMKEDYAQLVTLANEGSRELGYKDTGALWRSWYDMEPDAFAAETDRLWSQGPAALPEPALLCARAAERQIRRRRPAEDGPDPRRPPGQYVVPAVGQHLRRGRAQDRRFAGLRRRQAAGRQGLHAREDGPHGRDFYSSLGLEALPATFYERSLITRPRDREVVCHASAWNLTTSRTSASRCAPR